MKTQAAQASWRLGGAWSPWWLVRTAGTLSPLLPLGSRVGQSGLSCAITWANHLTSLASSVQWKELGRKATRGGRRAKAGSASPGGRPCSLLPVSVSWGSHFLPQGLFPALQNGQRLALPPEVICPVRPSGWSLRGGRRRPALHEVAASSTAGVPCPAPSRAWHAGTSECPMDSLMALGGRKRGPGGPRLPSGGRIDSSCPLGWGWTHPTWSGTGAGAGRWALSSTWVPRAHTGQVAWHRRPPLSLQQSCLQR